MADAHSTQWFYKIGSHSIGPVDMKALEKAIARGEVTARTRVWTQSLGPVWKKAAEVSSLASLLVEFGPRVEPASYQVSQMTVWLMAVTPLLSLIFSLSLSIVAPLDVPELRRYLAPLYFAGILPFMCAGFYLADRRVLENLYAKSVPAGYLIFLFLPPVFFLLRKNVDENQSILAALVALLVYPLPYLIFYAILMFS